MLKESSLALLISLLIIVGSAIYLFAFYKDGASVSTSVANVRTISEYSGVMEAVYYDPEPDHFVGFKICDEDLNKCEIYGVESSRVEGVEVGSMYNVVVNDVSECTTSAVNSYCEVMGDISVTPVTE